MNYRRLVRMACAIPVGQAGFSLAVTFAANRGCCGRVVITAVVELAWVVAGDLSEVGSEIEY